MRPLSRLFWRSGVARRRAAWLCACPAMDLTTAVLADALLLWLPFPPTEMALAAAVLRFIPEGSDELPQPERPLQQK